MNNIRIEIDPNVFHKYSGEELENKKDQIGYYQKDHQTYVFTLLSSHNSSHLVTKIGQISKILEIAQITGEFSSQHSIKAIQYFDYIYRIIDRHNEKLEIITLGRFAKILLAIPLINKVVLWLFKPIPKSEEFLVSLFEKQEESIGKYLEESKEVETLLKRKNELTSLLEGHKVAQSNLKGLGHLKWKKALSIIEEQFLAQIIEKSSPLKCANNIVDMTFKNPEKTYAEILTLKDSDDISKASESYNRVLKTLSLEPSEEKCVPASLKRTCVNAKSLVNTAYAQWHTQRILRLSARKAECLTDLLDTQNPKEFAEKYKFFFDILAPLTVSKPAQNALRLLQTTYSSYLQERLNLLSRQLNGVSPLYLKINDQKALLAQFQAHKEIISEWDQFQKSISIEGQPANSNAMIISPSDQLKKAYFRQLASLIPIFNEAAIILKLDLPHLRERNKAPPPANDENWYEINIRKFEFEISRLDLDALSYEAFQVLLNVKKKLAEDLVELKKKQFTEALQTKKPTGVFGLAIKLFSSLWGADNGKEQPLKQYTEQIIGCLKLPVTSSAKEIEEKYENEISKLLTLPNSKESKTLLENTYLNYIRALQLQPFLNLAAGGFAITGHLQELLKETPAHDFCGIEKVINSILKHIQDEINIQSSIKESPLIKTLQTVKESIISYWNAILERNYPQYSSIRSIQRMDVRRDMLENLYVTLLKIDLKTSYQRAIEIKESLLENITIKTTDIPLHLQDAYLIAANLITYAYKEWEAARILVNRKECKNVMMGIGKDASTSEVKKRYRTLQLLLHPDRNFGAPPKILLKITEANKLIE